MILSKGEKVHVIHRRVLEKEPHRHFIGEVEDYEHGVARVDGYFFTVDRDQGGFVRREDKRIRLIPVGSGDCIINVIPESVDLEQVVYHQEKKVIRVSDGSSWHLDISEVTWL